MRDFWSNKQLVIKNETELVVTKIILHPNLGGKNNVKLEYLELSLFLCLR